MRQAFLPTDLPTLFPAADRSRANVVSGTMDFSKTDLPSRWTRGLRVVAMLGLAGACLPSSVSAETLRAHYDVTLMGLHIGELSAEGNLQPKAYRMGVNAHLTGLAAMVSNVQMALVSSGAVNKRGNVAPTSYATSAANSESTRTLRMALNAGTVKAVEINPQPEWRGERVPVTEANKRNVLDPTSALIMPVPAGEALTGPAACQRTLPIYDGYARFDIALHYEGTRDVQVQGYSGPVAMCSARYHPVSGHLVGSRQTAFMAQNEGIEVWLAPIANVHVVVPIRVTMPTMTGRLDIEADDFEVAGAPEVTH